MRRKVVFGVVLVVVLGFFFIAPIIYSPFHVQVCGGPPVPKGQAPACHNLFIPAYDSPSCLLLHVGVAGDNWTSGYHETSSSISFYDSGGHPWSLYFGCAPQGSLNFGVL